MLEFKIYIVEDPLLLQFAQIITNSLKKKYFHQICNNK